MARTRRSTGGAQGKPAGDGRLARYRQRRHFDVTPEPSPEAPAPTAARGDDARPTFMVHKHDARRLHYDLRLEIDGALASWAVPKGPSYDPADKRLAVETEDHPLAYGAFEGRIPEGEYGAGDSIVWDRGRFDTEPPGQASEQRRAGRMLIVLDGEKLAGRWHLVRTRALGGKQQWLLFKAKDDTARADYDVVAARPESVVSGRRVTRGPVRAAARRATHPSPLDLLLRVWPPMLATLSRRAVVAPREEDYVYEVKYDGYRALASLSGGRVALQSRNGRDLAARFPDVVTALLGIDVPEAVLDGEIVACDPDGRVAFERLADPDAERRYAVFDLLWLDGEDLRARPLEERRDLLESLVGDAVWLPREPRRRHPKRGARIELAERIPGPLAAALAEAERREIEGLIAKRVGSRYDGRRSREWLKLKLVGTDELVVLGYLPLGHGQGAGRTTDAREVGALLVGWPEIGGGARRWRYAGRVGTGFSAAVRRSLGAELAREHARAPGRPPADAPRMREARWLAEPRRVIRVSFTEWTRDRKLRHPTFRGFVLDKAAGDVRPDIVVADEARAAGTGDAFPERGTPDEARTDDP